MKIGVATAWNAAYDSIAEQTVDIMQEYCEYHGYGFMPLPGVFHLDMDRDPSLLTYGDRIKLQIYKDQYKNVDAIAWLDVDCLITNGNKKLEDILGERNFLWTYGPSGPLSGFTIARTTPEVHLALHSVQHRAAEDADSVFDEDTQLRWVPVGSRAPGGKSDQDTMRFFMPFPPFDAVFGRHNLVSCKEAGHCMPFSRYGWSPMYDHLGNWETGDFLYTVPSIPVPERVEMLRAKRIEVYGG